MVTFAPRFTITNAITAGLTAIERARGFLESATLSEEWVERMSQRALLLEAHHTTHIEGTQLTIEQSERLWAGEVVEGARADDVRELLNYRDGFDLVSGYLSNGDPITEGLIREIHKRLVHGVRGGAADPGRFRTVQNYVANGRTHEVIYTPPPPDQVAPLMRELVLWLRADTAVHPVLVAGIAQFQLVHIHPFVDGNGRTSRLLSTLCLYRTGYDFKRLFTLSEFYDRDRGALYRAIQTCASATLCSIGSGPTDPNRQHAPRGPLTGSVERRALGLPPRYPTLTDGRTPRQPGWRTTPGRAMRSLRPNQVAFASRSPRVLLTPRRGASTLRRAIFPAVRLVRTGGVTSFEGG